MDKSLTLVKSLPVAIPALDLLHGLSVGVLVLDGERRISFCNRWLADQLGSSPSELLGIVSDRLLKVEDRPQWAQALSAVLSDGQIAHWQGTLCLRDAPQSFEFEARPIGDAPIASAVQLTCQRSSVLRAEAEQPRMGGGLKEERITEDDGCEMQALQVLGEMLQSSLDLRDVFRLIVDGVVTRLGYNAALLTIVDEARGALFVKATAAAHHLPDARAILADPKWNELEISMAQKECVLIGAVLEGRVATVGSLPELLRPVVDPLAAHELQQALHSQALVMVPLRAHGRLVGALIIATGQPGIPESEAPLLAAFAAQSALAIENAQLYDTVNQRLAEVSMLYMLANQVSSSLDLNVVLKLVMDILKEVLNCRGGCIFLLDEKGEWLEMRASSGIKPYWQREARMRLGEGIGGKVAQTAEPIYIPDTHRDPNFIVFDPAVRSLLVVPLISKGQVIGTLNVDDDKPNAFSDEVSQLLSIAASQAAAAIHTAKLYTDLKERAENLAQAHKELQESYRLRSEFVQNMSHELRTPLTFVRAYVDLLLDGTLGPLNDEQRNSMTIVAERTKTIIGLVNDILSLQKVERGELQFTSLSLQTVTQNAIEGAQATVQQAGLTLREECDSGLKPVWGDRARLDQVFNNLIGNAIKFSPDPGGSITIRLKNQDDLVRVDIVDQGIGIPPDQLGRIFDRFYQVDGSSTRRFGGTGLGLAIVKEIVDAHGGTISVSSQPGAGSTFSFTVPVAPDLPGSEGAINDDPQL